MKHSERLRRAGASAEFALAVANALEQCRAKSCYARRSEPHSALQHIVDAMNGHPGAQSFEQDRQSGHTVVVDIDGARPTVSDPTGEAAILRDHAAADLHRLDDIIRSVHRQLDEAVGILARNLPRAATAEQRRETSRFNDPGCESCARLPSHADPKVARYEPPHTKAKTDVGGVLDRPYLLCWWCRQFVFRNGRLPDKGEVERHHRGEIVRRLA